MKKILCTMLSMLLMFTVTTALAAEPIALKFVAQGDSTPATQAVVDAFNASQEAYVVEWVDMTNDSGAMREQLTTTLKAGSTEYDVLSLDVIWAGEFAAAGYIQPLDMMIDEAGLLPQDFNPGSMSSGLYNGKQYVLPFFPDLGLLYYRSDIVSEEDAAKLISGDYTFADLQTMAEAYQGQGETTTGFVFQASLYEGLICNATEFTAGWTDIRAGLEAMKAMVASDGTPDNILTYTEGETANSFVNGESVFARNWPYQWGELNATGIITKEQVGTAPLPGGCAVGGWLLAISENSENPEGAFAFIQFINSHEGQVLMSQQGGYLPGVSMYLDDETVTGGDDRFAMDGFQNALQSTIARPVSAEYSRVSDDLQQAIHAYLTGAVELDATMIAVEAALSL